MNEQDHLRLLAHGIPKEAAPEFLKGLLGMGAEYAKEYAKNHAPELIGAGVGAGAAGIGGYLRAKPRKGGLSIEQEEAKQEVDRTKAEAKEGKPQSFSQKLRGNLAPAFEEVANTMAKHPVKSALLFMPLGAYAGHKLGPQVAKLLK